MRRSSRSGSRFCRPRAMVLASSPISAEKNRVGPGMAGTPKKPDRCDIKHEIVALILSCIRRGVAKRRKREEEGTKREQGGVHPPFCINIKIKELQNLHFVSR